ncbi:MAG: prepilin-type N-terminal cleavage/methylation domain-containing protein [Candidatus Omnitrophota bacterium]
MDNKFKKVRWKSETAFTLVEILIALSILAVGILGLVNLFPVGLDATKQTVDISTAAIVAQRRIEEIKADGYNQSITYDGTNGNYTEYPNYTWGVTVVPHGMTNNLRIVTVNVTWTFRGQPRTETFVTYIAQYTP